MGFLNDFKKNYNENLESMKERKQSQEQESIDKEQRKLEKYKEKIENKKEKYKQKYNLRNIDDLDVKILDKVKGDIGIFSGNKTGIFSSEKEILSGQADLLRALVDQNWMILNALKSIEKRLENLENK